VSMNRRRRFARSLRPADQLHRRRRGLPGVSTFRGWRERRHWHKRFSTPLGSAEASRRAAGGRPGGGAFGRGGAKARSGPRFKVRRRVWSFFTSSERTSTIGGSDPAATRSRMPQPRGDRLRHPFRRAHMYPRPRRPRSSSSSAQRSARGPRMRPRRSMVDRVVPGEPSAPRTVVRLRVVGVIVAATFSLMFVRLWYLQVLDTKGFAQAVTANQVRNVEVPAPRGLILDRTGQTTLVGNQVTEDITLSRVAAQQNPAVVGQLGALLGIPPSQIQGDLANPQYSLYKPVPILENAPMSDVLYISEHSSQFPGVSATADTNRTYPMGQTGVQMLGYVGQIQPAELASSGNQGYQLGDLYGQSGLENEYESYLRGVPGVQHVEVNAQGQVVGSLGQSRVSPGADLVTNIDAGLEQTLQQALDSQIASLHGASHSGAAIALDPQTGAVLALVSSPTYDPTWWTPNGISTDHYKQIESNGSNENLVIDGLYTPGSTFKLATATAALQDGLISPGYYYNDTGSFTIPGCTATGAGCATFHDNEGEIGGEVNVTKALTISSDIFFYNLGVTFWDDYKSNGKYGETPIQDAANALGYGEVTGIDLPGETHYARVDSPQVVAREHAQDPKDYPNGQWFTGNNLEMAFGQGGTVVTPIEQAVAYATFANGGTRYAPEIAAGVVDPVTHKVVKRFAPKVTGHVAYTPDNYQALLNGFEGAVYDPKGTAYGVFNNLPPSFKIAGKTGTATVQEGQNANSWFVGWGPLPDPRYLIAVVVQGGGYGSSAAAPVVAQAFGYLAANPASPVDLVTPANTELGSGPCPNDAGASGSKSSTSTSAPTTSTTSTTSPSTGNGASTTTTLPCPPSGGSANSSNSSASGSGAGTGSGAAGVTGGAAAKQGGSGSSTTTTYVRATGSGPTGSSASGALDALSDRPRAVAGAP
jgi:penicillin-binding protein 2